MERLGRGFQIVATGKVFFQPDIEANEEVAATHFFDLELGHTCAAITPSDRYGGEAEAPDNGFQWEFDRDVEMRGEDRADAIDDFPAIGLEGVRCIIQAVAEEEPDEKICRSVQGELKGWVVDHTAVLDETAPKDALVAFVEFFPVADNIAAVVGFVGHHDDNGVANHGIKATRDGATEAVRSGVFDGTQGRDFCGFALQNLPSGVSGPVIHHNDFMGNAAKGEFEVEMLNGRGNTALFVARRNDDRQQS